MDSRYVKLKDIKPALAGYIRESQMMLGKEPVPDDRAIHDVRVLMKKARAALKLVAPQQDTEFIKKDIVALREVGRKMCAWRETSVLRKNLKGLKKEFPLLFSQLGSCEKINLILKKPDVSAAITQKIHTESEEINALLKKTGFRIRFMSMSKLDPDVLFSDLEKTYARVSYIYLACRNNPKPSKIHEFRKRTKDFLYQIYFFRPVNPSGIKKVENKLDNLTRNLGRYNDLTQLLNALDYDYSLNRNMPALDELVLNIREKQDRYLSKVWPDAFDLFSPGQKLVSVLGFKLLKF
jgi:CHAD domain-containing protein